MNLVEIIPNSGNCFGPFLEVMDGFTDETIRQVVGIQEYLVSSI